MLCFERICLLLREEGSDRLGRMREGRIVRIHLHLRHDGRDMPALVRLVHSDTKGLLEVVADISLAHGTALRQPMAGAMPASEA